MQALEPAVPGRARLYVRDLDDELELGGYAIAIQRSQNSYYLHSAQSRFHCLPQLSKRPMYCAG
ncbi:hypothetical protein QWA_18212, partial [Alcaligenes faecalis subsp. faecalis NCIB 8687]